MTPAYLLEELLRYHKVKSSITAEFAALSHDDICRTVLDKIDVLLGAFDKYQHISYMTQGPRDNGVDVLLEGLCCTNCLGDARRLTAWQK